VAARDMVGPAIVVVEEIAIELAAAVEVLVDRSIVKLAIGLAAAVDEALVGHQVEICPSFLLLFPERLGCIDACCYSQFSEQCRVYSNLDVFATQFKIWVSQTIRR